jgi:hypothetical protein
MEPWRIHTKTYPRAALSGWLGACPSIFSFHGHHQSWQHSLFLLPRWQAETQKSGSALKVTKLANEGMKGRRLVSWSNCENAMPLPPSGVGSGFLTACVHPPAEPLWSRVGKGTQLFMKHWQMAHVLWGVSQEPLGRLQENPSAPSLHCKKRGLLSAELASCRRGLDWPSEPP